MAAEQHILRLLHDFSLQNLSAIVWAYATVKCTECSELMLKVAKVFVEGSHHHRVLPFDLATFTWGLASLRLKVDTTIISRISDVALVMLSKFKPYEFSTIVWAVSIFGYRHDDLFEAIARLLRFSAKFRNRVNRHCITNILWSFTKQIQLGSEVVDRLREATSTLLPKIRRLVPQLKPYQFSWVVSSLAQLGMELGSSHDADEIFASAAARAEIALNQLSTHSCVNLLAALTSFVSGTNRFEIPDVYTACQASLVRLCLARNCDLDAASASCILKVAPRIANQTAEVASLVQMCMLKVVPDMSKPSALEGGLSQYMLEWEDDGRCPAENDDDDEDTSDMQLQGNAWQASDEMPNEASGAIKPFASDCQAKLKDSNCGLQSKAPGAGIQQLAKTDQDPAYLHIDPFWYSDFAGYNAQEMLNADHANLTAAGGQFLGGFGAPFHFKPATEPCGGSSEVYMPSYKREIKTKESRKVHFENDTDEIAGTDPDAANRRAWCGWYWPGQPREVADMTTSPSFCVADLQLKEHLPMHPLTSSPQAAPESLPNCKFWRPSHAQSGLAAAVL
eukprot:gnl/TRDRNA2_/TRDRNA2_176767_c2_seq2.p1 gnl/TRDRNA2_/TRDRNA2_176767_c2~~gnl/TRDRNA2_/TRDRNA2_176767_c2_seq2.p1  ORF type:complete len:637 (+),score=124.03 gnl/TRDRNA2_/TRDRNA2_176767_c2_seq2:222-1913(+)